MGSCFSSASIGEEERARRLRISRQNSRLRNNLVQQSATKHPLEKYEIVKQLGVGSMGTVSMVRLRKRSSHDELDEENQRYYAMKAIRVGRVSGHTAGELMNEIEIVRDLDHPSIVRFFDVYYEGNKKNFIIMELCSGGDLYNRGPYSENEAKAIARQLFGAVFYMHNRGYVHRDLKFSNIMFQSPSSPYVKIIDFGLSGRYDKERPLMHKAVGTFQTMAPEVFGGNYFQV